MTTRVNGPEAHPVVAAPGDREWVIVDGVGGSAHGNAAGIPLRRAHAWLHAPGPGGEVLTTLLGLEERVRVEQSLFDLAFPAAADAGSEPATLESFDDDPWPRWRLRAGPLILERSLLLIYGHHAAVAEYRHVAGPPARLRVSPLVVARPPGSAQREGRELRGLAQGIPGRVRVETTPGGPTLTLWHQGSFMPNRLWRRGIDHAFEPRKSEEDALVPGHIDCALEPGGSVYVVASTEESLFRTLAVEGRLGTPPPGTLAECVATLALAERGRRRSIMAAAIQGADYTARQAAAAHGDGSLARRAAPLVEVDDPWTKPLAWAAWQGLARREGRLTVLDPLPAAEERPAIALRALPGLISIRAFEAARETLRGYAGYLDDGLLPAGFDELGQPRSGDAAPSLWMIHVAELLARRSEDVDTVRDLYPMLESVLQYYRGGTRGGIKVDADGLLMAGEDGIKPAGLNALWYHALVAMAQLARLVGRKENAAFYLAWARQHGQCFNEVFWDPAAGGLHDQVSERGPRPGLAAEHLLAVALTPAVLAPERAALLVARVERELFTPLGLRPDPEAAHVEPAWLGAYLGAYLRVHGRGAEAQARVREWLEVLRGRLGEATAGHVPEAFEWPALRRATRRAAPLPLAEARPRGASPLAAAEILRVWIEEVAHTAETAAPV